MENFNQAVVANNISDDEDSHIFRVFGLPRLVEQIILIKQSSTDVTSLELNDVVGNERAWNRLGCILGESIHVKELTIQNCSILDVLALGNGLRHNKCIHIMQLLRINLQGEDRIKMSGLSQFLSNNPSLKEISILYCNLGPAGIDILSNALINLSRDTLEFLSLSGNGFGDIDLSSLTVALVQCKQLRSLFLSSNGLGQKACASLVRLLEHQESNLQCLYLKNNSIDNNCAAMLSDALSTRRDEHGRVLSKNTALQSIHLYDNNMITKEGWMAMLKLICNTSSIEHVENSNHFLYSLGTEKSFYSVLGIDDANLLQSALKLNEDQTKMTVVRRKVIWSHARGCLNIGRSSIPTAAMPEVLSCFMDDSTNANLIQYHDPPLPKSRLDTIRLDSVYRIVKSRPVLCQYEEPNNKKEQLLKLKEGKEPLQLVAMMFFAAMVAFAAYDCCSGWALFTKVWKDVISFRRLIETNNAKDLCYSYCTCVHVDIVYRK